MTCIIGTLMVVGSVMTGPNTVLVETLSGGVIVEHPLTVEQYKSCQKNDKKVSDLLT